MSEDRILFHERVEWLGRNNANASGQSDKFYEVTITCGSAGGFVETRRWGRYGTAGQTKVLTHWSEYSALDSAHDQIRAKRAKGYTSVVAPLNRLAAAGGD